MKKYTCILAWICSSFTLTAQPYFEWGIALGGTDYDISNSVTYDDKGNVYTTGCFNGTADFDPGSGNYDLTSAGSLDVFISKLDADGNFVWARQLSGSSDEQATSIAVDSKGNVFVTGFFQGTTDFNPASGSFNLTSFGGLDIFICKFDESGNFVWAKQMGGTTDDVAQSIKIDERNNILTTGEFSGTADFNPGSGTNNLTPSAFIGTYISKLNASGNYVWAKTFGGTGNCWGYSLKADKRGSIYLTGYFDDKVDFDPGSGTSNITPFGNQDVFICKLDSFGNYKWAGQIGGTSLDKGWGIALDNIGHIYITGGYSATADLNPGSGSTNVTAVGDFDIFVTKLDTSGNFIWGKSMGGNIDDIGYSIAADETGAYTTGYFNTQADFNPGSGTFNLTSAPAGRDAYISKLDTSGNFVWAKQIGGTGADNLGYNITVDKSRNIYTTGYFTDSVDINPNSPKDMIPSAGSADIFLQKLSQCLATTSNISRSACNSYQSPSGKYTWTTSGTYKDTIDNAGGCDSIITIQLKINITTTNTISASACSKYTSPSGKYQWTVSGTYKDTIPNKAGCDSALTINLTIGGTPSSSTFSAAGCNKYISPSGKYQWTTSGTYKDTIPNKSGCDSAMTINLTINTMDVSVTQQDSLLTANATGVRYQWLDCKNGKQPIIGDTNQSFIGAPGGRYAVLIIKAGCIDTSACYHIASSAIAGIDHVASFSIHPNPTSGLFNIFTDDDLSGAELTLIDMHGRIILQKNDLNGREYLVDMSSQAAGIYFIELSLNQQTTRLKLVKY